MDGRLIIRPWCFGAVVLLAGVCIAGAEEPQSGKAAGTDSDDLYAQARELFDQYAPPEVKKEYEFASREEFEAFETQLETAWNGDSMEALARCEPQARQLLAILRAAPGYEAEADWLESRLRAFDMAPTAVAHRPAPQQEKPERRLQGGAPFYQAWVARARAHPPPESAAALMPGLKAAFAAEGAPPQLAWIAEAESSMNPDARSPSGAKGLFQLKAETARSMGLNTFLPDERTDPGKSARAAAKLLSGLRERLGSWPLAIAAYNAGEGRVRRAIAQKGSRDYSEIASALPAGTRLYVPEVCALVAARTGRDLSRD